MARKCTAPSGMAGRRGKMDRYEDDTGKIRWASKAEVVAWAVHDRAAFRDTHIWLVENGFHVTDVSTDIADELAKIDDDAKSEIEVIREALQQLSAAHLRLSLETSSAIESLRAEIAIR